jgi:site-specific recombinase XerD
LKIQNIPTRKRDRTVADTVKRYAERIRMVIRTFGGHMLRAGFLTSAAATGAGALKICDISRHRSMNTLQSYVRDAIGPTFKLPVKRSENG